MDIPNETLVVWATLSNYSFSKPCKISPDDGRIRSDVREHLCDGRIHLCNGYIVDTVDYVKRFSGGSSINKSDNFQKQIRWNARLGNYINNEFWTKVVNTKFWF